MSRPSNKTLYDGLKSLMDGKKHREEDCRDFLKYVPYLLFKDSKIKQYLRVDTECRGYFGDSDYVISGIVEDESCVETAKAYIWEFKAPQCYLFEKDGSNNRLRPTLDLIKAENQLLHYWYENKDNTNFRKIFKVYHSVDVELGGIIIGCNKTLFKLPEGADAIKFKESYDTANKLRQEFLYRKYIKLMTWDYILEHFATKTLKGKKKTGKEMTMEAPPSPNMTIEKAG